MRPRCASAVRSLRRTVRRSAPLWVMWVAVAPAVGDIFHLTTGGRVEGDLIEQTDAHYRIRTPIGTITLETGAVVRVETALSPFAGYDERSAQAPDTVAGQLALADWCVGQGLHAESRRHYRRALELDPDCAPARRALGYVRIGDLWVEGRRESSARPADEEPAADAEAESAKLGAAIQATWQRRIQNVKSGLLDSGVPEKMAQGAAKIREITDPLAIVPLVRVLRGGDRDCRMLLAEMLGRYREDLALVNLMALVLDDPDRDVRRVAQAALARREDQRVVDHLREGVASDDDELVRRAAEALGVLRAPAAVPELIGALKVRRVKRVEVSMARYLGSLPLGFQPSYVTVGGERVILTPQLVLPADMQRGTADRRPEQEVTVYRTEVLEALRETTGVDFGFDEQAWSRWLEESRP